MGGRGKGIINILPPVTPNKSSTTNRSNLRPVDDEEALAKKTKMDVLPPIGILSSEKGKRSRSAGGRGKAVKIADEQEIEIPVDLSEEWDNESEADQPMNSLELKKLKTENLKLRTDKSNALQELVTTRNQRDTAKGQLKKKEKENQQLRKILSSVLGASKKIRGLFNDEFSQSIVEMEVMLETEEP